MALASMLIAALDNQLQKLWLNHASAQLLSNEPALGTFLRCVGDMFLISTDFFAAPHTMPTSMEFPVHCLLNRIKGLSPTLLLNITQ